MKKDALHQQEQTVPYKRLSALLKRIKPPYREKYEWTVLENNLFAAMDESQPFLEKNHGSFSTFFSRPFALVPVAATLLLFFAVFIFRYQNSRLDTFTHAVSIQGKLVASASSNSKIKDTLACAENFSKIPNSGKGFTFKTLENSSLIMQLDQGSAFELARNSIIFFKEISNKHLFFDLEQGSLLVKVSKRLKDQKFIISTPSASCSVVGTIFKVDVCNSADAHAKQTVLTVYEGKVKFTAGEGNQTIYVASGQTCVTQNTAFGAVRAISESETPIKDISVLELLINHTNSPGVKYGFIDVNTQPDQALIVIDDSLAGKAPILARKKIGRHSIIVSANGYAPSEKIVEIGKDSISRVTIFLNKNAGIGKPVQNSIRLFRSPAKLQPESTLVAVPEYVEAMVQITIGEYQKAVGILDSLKNNQPIDMRSRVSIMKKINSCYVKLGNFKNALDRLEEKYEKSSATSDKENMLWEMANLKANCIGDFQGAEMALVELLVIDPEGIRAHDAYGKLAEIQYILNKFGSAVATYRQHIAKFPHDPDMDKSLFSLANIIDGDMHNYKEAFTLYSKLLKNFPNSSYFDPALFARSQCLFKLGRVDEAKSDLRKYLRQSPQGVLSSVCLQQLKEFK